MKIAYNDLNLRTASEFTAQKIFSMVLDINEIR